MIEVPTLDGPEDIEVPRGTQSGETLADQGAWDAGHRRAGPGGRAGGGRNVETPRHLTARQEELLREFAEIEHVQVSPRRKEFLRETARLFHRRG